MQSTDQRRSVRVAGIAGWGALLALAAWSRRPEWVWAAAAACGAIYWTLVAARRKERVALAGGIVLFAAVAVALVTQARLAEIASDWEGVRTAAETAAENELAGELDALVDRGEEAVDSAAEAAFRLGRVPLFSALEEIREQSGLSAVAVYGPGGAPVAWAGEHRGILPGSVAAGLDPYHFSSSPLFGYLYFSRRLAGGFTALSATLLDANVSVPSDQGAFSRRFAERHGIVPRFTTPERAQGEAVWDWTVEDRPILSVSFARLTQENWRDRVLSRGRLALSGAWLAAFVLLLIAWYPAGRGPPGVPVAVATAALLIAPIEKILGAEGIFSPLGFVLPIPGDLTLGDTLVLVIGAGVWLLTRSVPSAKGTPRLLLRGLLAAALLPLVIALIRASASVGLLAAHSAGGFALVLAATLAVAVPLYVLFPRPENAGRSGWGWLAFGTVVAVAFSISVAARWAPGRGIPVWLPALWCIPFLSLARGFSIGPQGRSSLLRWLAAGLIGGTIAAPHLWAAHMDARVEHAEREIKRLGTVPDPYLEFLLRQFAERALLYASQGREGVSLLYQSWVQGGLAQDGYEARVTLWQGAAAAEELRLSDVPRPDSLLAPLIARARGAEEPHVQRFTDHPGLHYLLVVPLPGARVITVTVPPRTFVGRSAALTHLLDPGRRASGAEEPASLSLVPATRPRAEAGIPSSGSPRWLRRPGGWRSEALVSFPSGPVHAHLLLRTTPLAGRAAQGVLLLALALAGMALLWGIARTLCGEPFGVAPRRWRWPRTFRGRLTLALFSFFLLPMSIFAASAYQALSREVVRTASALAERSLQQAAAEAPDQPLSRIAEHVGADLLLYREGVLADASSPEVLELGLYNSWLPPHHYLAFASSEAVRSLENQRLAGREYLIAYRRLGPERVLAAPTALASGEIARRQRELGNLVLLALLAGAAFSVILSLMVGRALSRPIDDLSLASSAVGSGDLQVRLPETRADEFGGLYRSFNRMVQRLRRARLAVARETRRTEAILAEAGTGVLALDAGGHIALANARAVEILGEARPGGPIPDATPIAAAVSRAVEAFRRSGEDEHGEEIEVESRVVRLRLRRLRSESGGAGAVVALEDITSEIRSARVLAWGEMARQVAHEIKNPLTPIKLAVQHLRRAHRDGRPEFPEILDRNVEAILSEIDRLGEIARAFARFGTPDHAAGDLEAVSLVRVVEETLSLYRGGGDGIEYVVESNPETPPALARVGELKEVLVNLLENARAALDSGGAIGVIVALDDRGAVHLRVRDTGEGIPEELLPRVFEPQFSTRTSGTGLGLAIVRRLVESWGGEVTVESEAGRGTTVHLRLRAADGVQVG